MDSKLPNTKQERDQAQQPPFPSPPPSQHPTSSLQSQSKRSFSTYTRLLIVAVAALVWIFLTFGSAPLRSREGGEGELRSRPSLGGSGGKPQVADPGTRKNNGLTKDVEWDDRSLFVKGQRLFIFSGEIHPWRLPVPGLWKDLTEKAKAAGFNAISIYVHWGLVNPKEGVTDWSGYRNLQPFFDYCRASGLFVVVRPGPHIQAEVSAGGIPGFVLGIDGELRTNATSYSRAWRQYVTEVSEIIRRNQVTEEGGVVIAVQVENEYYQRLGKNGRRGDPDGEMQWTKIAHMELLKSAFRDAGIVVPLTFNDVGFKGNFNSGPGSTDLYGWDAYPQGFDCSNPKEWYPLPASWQYDHQRLDPERPSYSPEFQGGAFDPWGGVGYEKCEELTGADFERVFHLGIWSANVKMISLYMLYGGTSWGQMPFPGVYSSYDYGAAIAENRHISSKFDELKRQGLFLRNVKDFAGTTFVANSTVDKSLSTSPDVLSVHLRNFETQAGFYISRHTNSSSFDSTLFGLTIETSRGSIFVNNLPLHGRDARITTTDFKFGQTHLLFTTGQILVGTTVGDWDVLILFAPKGERIALSLIDNELDISSAPSFFSPVSDPEILRANGLLNISAVVLDDQSNPTVLSFGRRVILLADTVAAATYWQPTLARETNLGSFFAIGTNESVIVAGPHLVRSASIDGTIVKLTGDLNSTTTLLLIAPTFVDGITWNGCSLPSVTRNSWGALEAPSIFSAQVPFVPELVDWRFKNSLPEIEDEYDDSRWTLANLTTSTNPFKPLEGNSGSAILFANDYGFHQGNILWRGRFHSPLSAPIQTVELEVASGWGGGFSVWLEKTFLGSIASRGSDFDSLRRVFNVSCIVGGEKEMVLTVLQDHMGYHNDNDLGHGNDDFKMPRGIIGYKLGPSISNFTSWKVQGNLGGEDFVDRTRGIINEGGLFSERSGWHLPGFDTTSLQWETRSPSQGVNAPGVGFFVTTFNLSIPSTVDAPISLAFSKDAASYRVQIYINGWQMGKLSSAAGPQHRFPLPQIVKNGTNTLAISLWALGNEPRDLKIGSVWLEVDGVVEGGPGEVALDNPSWTRRDVF